MGKAVSLTPHSFSVSWECKEYDDKGLLAYTTTNNNPVGNIKGFVIHTSQVLSQ